MIYVFNKKNFKKNLLTLIKTTAKKLIFIIRNKN